MKRLSLIIILSILIAPLFSLENSSYFETSTGKMPFHPKKKSYAFTAGRRLMDGNQGLDFSVRQEFSSSLQTATSARGLVVFKNDKGFYAGVGPSITHYANTPPINYKGARFQHLQSVNMEAMIGYDIPIKGPIKPSLQVSVSQPLHILHSTFPKRMKKSPSVYVGLKFKY